MRILGGILVSVALTMACVAAEPSPLPSTPTAAVAPFATVVAEATKPPPPTSVASTPVAAPRWNSYPAGTRAGNGTVDRVIAAVEARDRKALLALISIPSIPCAAPRPVVPQVDLCREGAPVGTPIVGVWFGHIEGGLRSPEFAVDGFLGLSPLMFAVAEVTPRPEAIPFGAGDVEVYFWLAQGHAQMSGKLSLRDGLVTAFAMQVWDPNYQALPDSFKRWILPPP